MTGIKRLVGNAFNHFDLYFLWCPAHNGGCKCKTRFLGFDAYAGKLHATLMYKKK